MDRDGKEVTRWNEGERIVISEMTVEDLEEVLAIERKVSRSPWTEAMFRRELLLPLARRLAARFGGEKIAGYLIYWLVADELREIAELPSGGDTSYPGFVELANGKALVSYYSSHEADAAGKVITAIYLAELGLRPNE